MNKSETSYSTRTTLIIWTASVALLGLVRFFELRTNIDSSNLMKSLVIFVAFNSVLFFITLKKETHYALTFLTAIINLQLIVISYYVILQMINQL